MHNLKHIVENHMQAGNNRMKLNIRMPIKLSSVGKQLRGRVEVKLTGVDIAVFSNLNNQLINKRAWGQYLTGPFVKHEGTVHIECLCLSINKVEYQLDGRTVSPQSIKGMPPRFIAFNTQSKPRIRYFSTIDITKVEAGRITREDLYMQI